MKKRLNRKFLIIVLSCIALIVLFFGIIYLRKTIEYHKSYEYKFLKLGYSINDVKILNKLNNKNKDYILNLKYDKNIIELINQKYFIEDNLSNYIKYDNKDNYPLIDVVALINTHANNEWYSDTRKADTSKGNLMLTNKFYSLDSTYNSDNMIKVSNQYSFGDDQLLTKDTLDAFIEMFNEAKKENLTLIINSSFRSFEDQEEIYNYYLNIKGEEETNKMAAKPGFSEHQTGLSIDIQTYGSSTKNFEEFDEFKWLQNNAYKYGFILRYPKGKEYITGYEYESWHYRYVGIEAATYIYENNITFDEYYAYFVERNI